MDKVTHIGVGELGATSAPGRLKTMALGSCIAVVMLDPAKTAIGMVHVALPDSSIERLKALTLPGYFADTGITSLMLRMAGLGCDARGRGFIVKLIGGAAILDAAGVFNIGKRNLLSCRKLLWQLKLPVLAEDTGGDISRTVEVDQATGKTLISCPGKGTWEL
jgi:chemotaxis protein CheD